MIVGWRVVYHELLLARTGDAAHVEGACFLLRDEETGEPRGLFVEAERASPLELRRIADTFLEEKTPPSHVVVDRDGVVAAIDGAPPSG